MTEPDETLADARSGETKDEEGALAAGTVVAGKYRIEEVIGDGGMGIVHRATNVSTSKAVALKIMRPHLANDAEAVARFLREARAAGSIEHPNVVTVFDVEREGTRPFLVMELLRGHSLAEELRNGPIDGTRIASVLLPALAGLQAAHDKGLIHRDLKPENVFLCLDADGRHVGTKVLDFGLSKSLDGVVLDASTVTRSGAILGTPYYMSPEQLVGGELDVRSDVYSVGVILYRALTGVLPFPAKTVTELAVAVATAWLRPPRLVVPSIDARLETVVIRALAREPAARFPDVGSLMTALAPFAAGADATGASSARAIAPPSSGPRVALVAAVVAVVLALGAAWFAFGSGSPSSSAATTPVASSPTVVDEAPVLEPPVAPPALEAPVLEAPTVEPSVETVVAPAADVHADRPRRPRVPEAEATPPAETDPDRRTRLLSPEEF